MSNYRTSFWNSMPVVTKNLLIINVLMWFASIVLRGRGIDLTEYLGLHFWLASDFNPAQLLTYMFMHDTSGIAHLFFNMFSLFMFWRDAGTCAGRQTLFVFLHIMRPRSGYSAGTHLAADMAERVCHGICQPERPHV